MEFLQNINITCDDIILSPLVHEDFENLYHVASDPAIWEQHPNKDRWQRSVFEVFFEGAIKSKGAYKIVDKKTGNILGSTRFYDYDHNSKSILIGYTFFDTKYWGKGINLKVKKMMLDFIFKYVETVYFHIGAQNIRSQIAINKLGVEKIDEIEVTYFGELPKLNFVYSITKQVWEDTKLYIK